MLLIEDVNNSVSLQEKGKFKTVSESSPRTTKSAKTLQKHNSKITICSSINKLKCIDSQCNKSQIKHSIMTNIKAVMSDV